MKTAIRTFTLFVLIAIQMVAPVSAQASSQPPSGTTPALAAQAQVDAGLYHAVLDTTAKDAPAFNQTSNGFSLDASNLNYQLNSRGLSVSADDQDWSWGLQLDSFGREDQTNTLSAPKFSQGKGRTNLQFSNLLTEWYRDTGIGLEQGFTIDDNPKGNGKLVLHMKLDSTLNGSLSDDERSLSFDAGDGKSLHYSNLRAFDANGNELDAKIIYTPNQIVIHIDDNGAAYPLTIDPLIYFEQKQQVNGTVHENFGCTLALQGDTAVVGAPEADSNQGAAYVFIRSNSIWSLQAKLTASDGVGSTDQFGIQVALDGDTILVGSYLADVGANIDQGAAYIFVKPGGGWATTSTFAAKLTASDGAAGDNFGSSVALSGDTAVVGAAYADLGFQDQGAAYVFVKPNYGWTTGIETTKLVASDPGLADNLGYFRAVAISGDTILAGAPGKNSSQGAAYIFEKPASGWATASGTEDAKLTISSGLTNDNFGFSVALDGEKALIGTPGYNGNQGAAYIYLKPGGGWATTNLASRLTASDGAANDYFGYSVSMDGNTALIGAFLDDVTYTDQGSAYVFIKPTTGNWTSTSAYASKLTDSDPALSDWFGTQVALSGDTALVGAPLADGGFGGLGAVYFYYPYRSDQDLAMGAAVDNASPQPFDTVTFTATVSNFGSASAPYVQVSAPLPAGFTYVSSTVTSSYCCSYDSSNGAWDVGTLNFGTTATLKIVATVDSSVAGTSPVFTVKTLGTDLNPANDSASVSLHVPLLTFSPSPINFGNRLINTASPAQTIKVTNVSDEKVKLGALKVPLGFLFSSNTCTLGKTLDTGFSCTFK
ncbi:MAG TPA: hypothetical protein VHM28_08410, partial [Anaerolineales bacterium]|nr:hypothetical protein [Anaerolineales bacterium]